MAKDRRKLQHIHSSIPDKQPTPQSLEVGEIAVNNSANKEFLSLKNSNDKVVRFSSDEQMITWMEKKEVMPYAGYVRGKEGPSATSGENPTKDARKSYGITNEDLLKNESNLVFKLNQVVAENTVKHDKVNGAKDIYTKSVNPSTDDGLSDGAGFAIDMSRYAMNDANPAFSSVTVSAQTNLSGNTYITNGASANTYGTDTGHTLTIKTTDVIASGKTWGETYSAKTENISGRTTTIGNNNEVLHVIGTTTETHDKIVTITNNSGVTETTKGNVVENVSGTTIINHSGNTTTNETGNTVFNTTGNTTLNTNGSTTIQSTGNGSDVIVYAKDDLCATSDDVAAFKGANTTNIGSDCTNANQTKTLNVRANTADTRVTSAYTSATTATTIIKTSNTSATTATLSGDTLSIIENDTDIKSCGRISATTNDFEVKQCTANGKVVINSDDIDISGKTLDIIENTSTTIKSPDTTISGDNLTIIENSSTTIKSPETTISGCSKVEIVSDDLNLRPCTSAGTIDFNFCKGFSVESNKVSIEQCDAEGTLTIKEKATTISGTTLDIKEKDKVVIVGDNKVHVGGETVEVACDLFDVDADSNVCIESDDNARFYGANDTKVGVSCTNQLSKNTVMDSLSGTVVSSNSDTCVYGKNVNVGGDVRTRIGANCQGAVDSSYVEISATTSITETAPIIELSSSTTNLISNATNIDAISNVCVSAGTKANFYGRATNIGIECNGTTIATATTIEGTTVGISGNTTNISGATTLALSGKTINVDATDIDVDASNNYCLSAATKANIYGRATNIGIECGGGISTATTVKGTTLGLSGNTTNISGATTLNLSGNTVNISGNTNGGVNIKSPVNSDINIEGGDVTITGDQITIGSNLVESDIVIAPMECVHISGGCLVVDGDTHIKGDTYMSGKTYFTNTCPTVDANELSDALCEVISRGAVSMDVTSNPAPGILKRYTIKQNGANISGTANGVIDVPKDFLLKSAAVVYGNASADRTSFTACTGTQTNCHWYIELVFNVKDGTSEESKLYLEEDDFIKDITDNNPSGVVADSSYNNVAVKVEYDGKKNVVSATTTPTIHAKENIYADGNITGTNITASTAIRANNVSANTISAATGVRANNISANTISATTFYGKMSKSLTWSGGTFTADTTGYNGSVDKVITVPTAISHLPTRGKLTVKHNGLSDTYDPASDKQMTLPHSALTWQYGSVTGASSGSYNTSAEKVVTIPKNLKHLTNDLSNLTVNFGAATGQTAAATYNGSAATNITIPTSTAHLTKSTLTIDYGDVYGKTDTSYDTTAARTVTVPDSLANVSHQMVVDSTPANTGGTITFKKPINVSGTVTATGAIYSSDRNLKENIFDIDSNELEKAGLVSYKTYNFKGEDNKMYGIIAQDLQEAGLGELVYSREDGTLAVDYTSFMILELARLRRDNETLLNRMAWLEGRIDELEGKKKD